jgi:Rho-binding antiterminator
MEGVALDTQVIENREECIKIESDGVERLVVLNDIAKMEVCVENPHFKVVSFD